MREKAMREISVLRRIGDVANPRRRGDNVVTMLDYFEDKRRKAVYIVFPLYDCSLADVIPASTDDQMVRFHGLFTVTGPQYLWEDFWKYYPQGKVKFIPWDVTVNGTVLCKRRK